MPKISIVIPVYNVENYLDVCLDSIIAQSFRDFEVLCIDDGSTDSSPDILDRYAKFDKRIKIYHKENCGSAAARNFGIKKSSGEYITFVDSDDWLSHLMLERLLNNITETNADFNFCGAHTVNNYTREMSLWRMYKLNEFCNDIKSPVFNSDNSPSELMYKIHVTAWAKLYKSDFIRDFRFPEGMIFEDNPFYTECFLSAKKISYDHAPLYYYRTNRPNSVMKIQYERYRDIYKIADMVKNIYVKHSKYEKYKTDYLLHFLKIFLYYNIKNTQKGICERSFEEFKKRVTETNFDEYDTEKLKKDELFELILSVKDMDYQDFVAVKPRFKGGIND